VITLQPNIASVGQVLPSAVTWTPRPLSFPARIASSDLQLPPKTKDSVMMLRPFELPPQWPFLNELAAIPRLAPGVQKTWAWVEQEIERYSSYQDDWDGDGALGISNKVTETAKKVTRWLRSNDVAPPSRIVPTFAGELSFEWPCGRDVVELDIQEGDCRLGRAVGLLANTQ